MFMLIFVFILVYYCVTIISPFYFSRDKDICENGVPMESLLVYVIFAFITGIIELVIFKSITDSVGEYLPNIINEDEYNTGENDKGLVSKIKDKIKNNKWVTYIF